MYQKALAALVPLLAETAGLITTELTHRVLKIPLLIAQAHSWRFADQAKALATLEDAMTNSNLAVVYLEQYRDICNTGIEIEFFEEEIKGLVGLRQKTLYLQRSWKKFITEGMHQTVRPEGRTYGTNRPDANR